MLYITQHIRLSISTKNPMSHTKYVEGVSEEEDGEDGEEGEEGEGGASMNSGLSELWTNPAREREMAPEDEW